MQNDTAAQERIAHMIAELLNQDLLTIRPTVFDCFTDRKIFIFQIFPIDQSVEMCMLQQIIYTNKTKEAHIFIRAKNQYWNQDIVQNLLDIVFEKLKMNADKQPKNKSFFIE